MTVRELLDRVDSRELTEWMAYEHVTGPFGPDRSDIHAGIIASTVANASKGKRGKKFEPKDFIPQWDKPEQTWEDQLRAVKQIHGSMTRQERRRNMRRSKQDKQQTQDGTNGSKEVSSHGDDR